MFIYNKRCGGFPAKELEEQLQIISDKYELIIENMFDEKRSKDNRPTTFIPAVIGCYNGHWIVKYEYFFLEDLNKYTSEVFFYDKDGNPWHHKNKY